MLVRRSDRRNIVIKYRADARSPWHFGSSGVRTKREAAKLAAGLVTRWLADNGRECDLWSDFRDRYEDEHLDSGKPKTAEAFRTAANRLESLCNVRFIQDLDEAKFSQFAAKLRKEGKSPATVRAYQDHLMSALKWAVQIRILAERPTPPPIKVVESSHGRALTREEAERIAMQLPKVAGKECATRWAWNLEALWRSGFRSGETFAFTWEPSRFHHVEDLDGDRPMIAISAEHEKGGRHRKVPMTPDFAHLLRAVDPADRRGQVFKWTGMRGGFVTKRTVEKRIAQAGRKAGVIVGHNTAGEDRFATIHDFRRSFGARWSTKVMPPVLQAMMRHKSIETTLKFYVGENAKRNADAIWLAAGHSESAVGDAAECTPGEFCTALMQLPG
ncbi:tyrosine-type recombinase/integrase [Roseiconus nitratireducens]|nr:site-specific integrase [Roseiconus nitratireducens]